MRWFHSGYIRRILATHHFPCQPFSWLYNSPSYLHSLWSFQFTISINKFISDLLLISSHPTFLTKTFILWKVIYPRVTKSFLLQVSRDLFIMRSILIPSYIIFLLSFQGNCAPTLDNVAINSVPTAHDVATVAEPLIANAAGVSKAFVLAKPSSKTPPSAAISIESRDAVLRKRSNYFCSGVWILPFGLVLLVILTQN